MKYIRTKDGVFKISQAYSNKDRVVVFYSKIINDEIGFCCELPNKDIQLADTIEELCVGICVIERNGKLKVPYVGKTVRDLKVIIDLIDKDNYEVYGAIWTDKGLIYVAKMNDKGELELL